MRNLTISILCLILISVLVGCSGSRYNSISPPIDQNTPDIESLPVGVTGRNADGSPAGGMGDLGLFQLSLDKTNVKAELTPLRNSTTTDVLEIVDITNFLQMAPCTDCVKIKSVALDSDGHLVVSIGIKHPFPAGDPFKPTTGRNRADLHVFNVEGTIISNLAATSFPGLGESTAGFNLLNADGYSKYLDASLDDIYTTNATIHPYKLHFDDYSQGNFDPANPMGFDSVTDPPPTGNLVMAMGCDFNFQDYIFDLPSGHVDFIYAVGCTYAVASASKSHRFSPEYRIPQHNKKAASEVSYQIVQNNLKDGDTTSTAEIEVHVVDINNGVPTGIALNEMLSESSVNNIIIDVPGVMTNTLVINGSSPISGTGHSPSDPLVYTGTITNTTGATQGTYAGLIKVLDTYAPHQNVAPTLQGKDGIKRVDPLKNPVLNGLFDITEFATYQILSIDVSGGNLPPVGGNISFSWACPGDPCTGNVVTFTISEAYDPDGQPVTITWDFDEDLDYVDDQDGSDTNLSGEYTFNTAGSFNVWCRIDDSQMHTDIGPFAINVLDCVPNNPAVLNTVTHYNQGYRMDINREQMYEYTAHTNLNDFNELQIVDIDPASSASEVSSVPISAWVVTCAYYNGYVYVAGQAMLGIVTVDVDPPETASIVNTWTNWSMTGSMEDMVVHGDKLYVAAQWGGMMIFDLSNPAQPALLSHTTTTNGCYTDSVEVSSDGQWGYYMEGYWSAAPNQIRVVDITNPSVPNIVHDVPVSLFPMDLAIIGNSLCAVTHPWAGALLTVVDIADPANASVLTTYSLPHGAWVVQSDGIYLYVSGGDLTVVDMSNPGTPSTLLTFDIANEGRGLRVNCGTAYVDSFWFDSANNRAVTDLNIIDMHP